MQLKFTKSHDQIVKTLTKSLKFKDFRKLRMLVKLDLESF